MNLTPWLPVAARLPGLQLANLLRVLANLADPKVRQNLRKMLSSQPDKRSQAWRAMRPMCLDQSWEKLSSVVADNQSLPWLGDFVGQGLSEQNLVACDYFQTKFQHQWPKIRALLRPQEDQVLVQEILLDLANPLRITTPDGPTCSSTCAQVKMAKIFPLQYCQLVLSLSQGQDFSLPGTAGGPVRALYGWQPQVSGSKTEQLFQTNLQNFASSATSLGHPAQNLARLFNHRPGRWLLSRLGLDPAFQNFLSMDTDRYDPNSKGRWGHCPLQMEYLHHRLFGATQLVTPFDSTVEQMKLFLHSNLQRGWPVAASVIDINRPDWKDAFHVITVVGHSDRPILPVEDDRGETSGWVQFHTWGSLREIRQEDFWVSCLLLLGHPHRPQTA